MRGNCGIINRTLHKGLMDQGGSPWDNAILRRTEAFSQSQLDIS